MSTPNTNTNKILVPQSFVGLLYENGAFKHVLEPGTKVKLRRGLFDDVIRSVILVDLRERSLTLKGQEILTADKVAIRVSLLVYFRITDPSAAVHNVASYEERIYEDVQLGARRFLASRSLDAILSDRNEISDAVRDDVKSTAARYGVEILRADVKDLVFPGNLREIMNQVLETERKAEAKLLQAKKEAEAHKIAADAENERTRQRLTAERDQARLRADAALEAARSKLVAEVEEAKALEAHPALLKLREIEALAAMARAGGKFVVGLPDGKLTLTND
jgi:regulator of protease activity HflC (stomatin/prohibitin superfamily)